MRAWLYCKFAFEISHLLIEIKYFAWPCHMNRMFNGVWVLHMQFFPEYFLFEPCLTIVTPNQNICKIFLHLQNIFTQSSPAGDVAPCPNHQHNGTVFNCHGRRRNWWLRLVYGEIRNILFWRIQIFVCFALGFVQMNI